MRHLISVVTLLTAFSSIASAQAPAQFPVQGYLTDSSGTPINGGQAMSFSVYNRLEGGTLLHSEVQLVEVDQGYFTAYIGEVQALDLSVFRDIGQAFVEVTIGSETLTPRKQIATAPYAAYAEYAAEADRLAQGLPFSELLNVPAGIEDGDDNTEYSAGNGITIDATNAISFDPATIQRRISGQCTAGEAIQSVGADGGLLCAELPEGRGAGTGLVVDGSNLAIDASYVQRRVTGTCTADQAARSIAANGNLTCVDLPDVLGAGTGLTEGGGNLSVDSGYVQRRLTRACSADQALQSIAENGTPSCVDLSEGPGAGVGLVEAGGNLAVNTSYVQRRVTGSCLPNEATRSINADGTVTCVSLPTVPRVGTGLVDSGGARSVNTSYVQRRVDGTCTADQAIRQVAADGSVTCSDMPVVPTTGAGLSESNGTLTADTSYLQRRVNSLCPSDQAIRSIGADGSVDCEAIPQGDITTVIAGDGLDASLGCFGGSCTLDVDPTELNGSNPISTEYNSSSRTATPLARWDFVDSIDVTPGSPLQGEVLVTAHAFVSCENCGGIGRPGRAQCWMGISQTSGASPQNRGYAEVAQEDGSIGGSGISTVRTFAFPASATTDRYYLNGYSSGGICEFEHIQMTAVFIPD